MNKTFLIFALAGALLLCAGGWGMYWAKAEALAKKTMNQADVIAELNQQVTAQDKEIRALKQTISNDPMTEAKKSMELSMQRIAALQKADAEMQKKWDADMKKLSGLLQKQTEELSHSLSETTAASAQPNF